MTVTEAVKLSGLTPSAAYTGVETTDDFLLAVQTEASQTDVKSWVVCADHVKEHSGALNATTTDNTYIRTGPVTTKGSVQRTLSIQGDRYVGDAFQDFLLSHKIAFGSGQSVVVPYVYFSLRTGSIEMTLDADGLEPGDVCFCSLPDLGYKATVRVADIIIQSQTDGTTRTARLGTPVWHKI